MCSEWLSGISTEIQLPPNDMHSILYFKDSHMPHVHARTRARTHHLILQLTLNIYIRLPYEEFLVAHERKMCYILMQNVFSNSGPAAVWMRGATAFKWDQSLPTYWHAPKALARSHRHQFVTSPISAHSSWGAVTRGTRHHHPTPSSGR